MVHGRTTCIRFDKDCTGGVWVQLDDARQRCDWIETPSQCLTARASLDEFAKARGASGANLSREIARALEAGSRCNHYSLRTPAAFARACAPGGDQAERERAEELRKLWLEIRHACGEKASLGRRQ